MLYFILIMIILIVITLHITKVLKQLKYYNEIIKENYNNIVNRIEKLSKEKIINLTEREVFKIYNKLDKDDSKVEELKNVYNNYVLKNNNIVLKFPNNIIAIIFGYKDHYYFATKKKEL